MDSTGLGELIGYLQKFEDRQRKMALVKPSHRILALLKITIAARAIKRQRQGIRVVRYKAGIAGRDGDGWLWIVLRACEHR
jgi:hypothetical protein